MFLGFVSKACGTLRVRSSVVEQLPFKEMVEGPIPSEPTEGGCYSSHSSLRDRLMVGQQTLDLLIGVQFPVPQPNVVCLHSSLPR